jgi:hypothetical protein
MPGMLHHSHGFKDNLTSIAIELSGYPPKFRTLSKKIAACSNADPTNTVDAIQFFQQPVPLELDLAAVLTYDKQVFAADSSCGQSAWASSDC